MSDHPDTEPEAPPPEVLTSVSSQPESSQSDESQSSGAVNVSTSAPSNPESVKTQQPPGEGIKEAPPSKITVRFRPMGATPRLKTSVFNVSSGYQFSALVTFLRKQLGFTPQRSLFCYVNGSFAPALDANLDDLLESYGEEQVLNIFYCGTVAFG